MEIAILGLGCFWGPERKFGEIDGVTNTEVGYCGGKNKDTNYQEVCTGTTGHAEVVKIEFDENIISYEKIINLFFDFHDPTTLDRQGPDIGTQYRSEIFYLNDIQKKVAGKVSGKSIYVCDQNKEMVEKAKERSLNEGFFNKCNCFFF